MRELEALLNKRCILKAEDKELYYKVRDQLGEIRKFASDKLGCHIIENALCIQVSVAIITYYLVIIIQLICI